MAISACHRAYEENWPLSTRIDEGRLPERGPRAALASEDASRHENGTATAVILRACEVTATAWILTFCGSVTLLTGPNVRQGVADHTGDNAAPGQHIPCDVPRWTENDPAHDHQKACRARLETTGAAVAGASTTATYRMTASVDDAALTGASWPRAPDAALRPLRADRVVIRQPEDADRQRPRNDRGDIEPGLDVGEFGADPTAGCSRARPGPPHLVRVIAPVIDSKSPRSTVLPSLARPEVGDGTLEDTAVALSDPRKSQRRYSSSETSPNGPGVPAELDRRRAEGHAGDSAHEDRSAGEGACLPDASGTARSLSRVLVAARGAGNGKQKRDPRGHVKRDPPVSVNSSVHDLLPWRLFRGCSDLADGLTLAVHIVTCALRSHSRARRVRLSADAPGGVRNRPP